MKTASLDSVVAELPESHPAKKELAQARNLLLVRYSALGEIVSDLNELDEMLAAEEAPGGGVREMVDKARATARAALRNQGEVG